MTCWSHQSILLLSAKSAIIAPLPPQNNSKMMTTFGTDGWWSVEQSVVPNRNYYSRICLMRHLKRIRKKWRIRRTDELCKQVKTIIEARILYHSNSYTYIVLLFAVKYKFMTLWLNTTINSSALSRLLHIIKHLLNL